MKYAIFCFLIMSAVNSLAQIAVDQEPLVFENAQQQQRFDDLTAELRCLVCQNQNLADSDAPLAHDLRDEIFKMMQSGNSNEQIKLFLTERYGDFVLYKPPLQGNTLFLWLAPLVLLLAGGAVVIYNIRKRTGLLSDGTEARAD
ncbi:MAG: cytochrome c-type biogenesis protein CcmH [Lysobacterales bacterium]|jgi:cytochrome c-type biogenesis protein CcmH